MIVYKISNNINNKIYIGITTVSLKKRWYRHLGEVKRSKRCLYNAMRKYGICNFQIQQIDTAQDLNELKKKEQFYIKSLNTLTPNGYNRTTGGDGSLCDHSKKQISNTLKEKYKDLVFYNKAVSALSKAYKVNIKKIIRYHIPTKIEYTYDSIISAKNDGFNPKMISKVINNNKRYYKENYWKFEHENIDLNIFLQKKINNIVKCTNILGEIYYFKSVQDMMDKSGFIKKSVFNNIKLNQPYKGYKIELIPFNKDVKFSDKIKEIPYIVGIYKDKLLYINYDDSLKMYGFDIAKVGPILKKEYGRKTHKGWKFIYFTEFIEGSAQPPGPAANLPTNPADNVQ